MGRNFTLEETKTVSLMRMLARKIGVSNKTYYNWMNGVSPIPSTALIQLANMFNVSIDYLLGRNKAEKDVVR